MEINNKQIWPASLREHLLVTYEYDKESGLIRRRHEAKQGPRSAGSVGTVTKAGDLQVVVHHEGKAYCFRAAKLAVFLETGEVYKKVVNKNQIKSDNRWENLMPMGFPDDEEGKGIKRSEELRENMLAEHRRVRLDKLKLDEEKRVAVEEANKNIRKAGRVEKPVNPNVETSDEPTRRFQEAWEEINAERIRKEALLAKHPFVVEHAAIWARYEYEHNRTKHLNGIHTGIKLGEAWQFLEACEATDRVSAIDFYKEAKAQPAGWLESQPKWIQDRLLVSKLASWKANPSMGVSDSQLQFPLDNYTWEGKPWEVEYDTIDPLQQQRMLDEIAVLERKYGTTMAKVEEECTAASKRTVKDELAGSAAHLSVNQAANLPVAQATADDIKS